MKIDLLIQTPHMYTMEGNGVGYRANNSIAIDRGMIIEIGPSEKLNKEYFPERRIDSDHHVLLPGFIDCHMHTRHAVIKGIAQDLNNWMWEGMAPFESQSNSEAKKAGSRLGIVEAIMNGTTTISDDGPDLEGSIQNVIEFGVRGNMSPRIREVDFTQYGPNDLYVFHPELGQKSLEDCIRLFNKYNNYDNDRIRILFGPQGADFLSSNRLKQVCKLANEYGTLVHMHCSQGKREDIQIQKRYNTRPILYLKSIGCLNHNLIGVHLTSATEDEVRVAVEHGISMILCSSSIAVINGQVPPAKTFIDYGGIVGLGSDQTPGNNNHNIFNEMKITSICNKCEHESPLLFPAWKVLRMATIEGAQAIGLGNITGSLEVGKAADMILVNLKKPTLSPIILSPMRNIINNLVYAARGDEVDTVIVNGKLVMENRKPLTFNLDEVIDDVQNQAEIIAARAFHRFWKVNGIQADYMRQGQL